MRIEHNVRADFQRPGVRPVIRVAEGDAGTRFVVMDLYNGGQPYSVGTGVTGVVKYAKTDGHSGVYDTLDEGETTERAAVVFHDSSRQAVVELATNICKGFGLVAVIVQFVKDSEILTTFPVDVIVERDPTDGTRSEDYFSFKALDALYNRLDEMESGMYAAIDEAKAVAEEALVASLADVSTGYAEAHAEDQSLTPERYMMSLTDGLYRISDNNGESVYIGRTVTAGGIEYLSVDTYYGGVDHVHAVYIDGVKAYSVSATSQDQPVDISPAAVVADIADIKERMAVLEDIQHPTSWEDVHRIVSAGLANRYFEIGDQLQCQKAGEVLTWDVIGINAERDADGNKMRSITLQLHNLLPSTYEFDAPELDNPDADRAAHGSNLWEESGIRQWLNSDAEAFSWFEKQGLYDDAPSYIDQPGFLNGLDPEFIAHLGSAKKETGRVETVDKVWLPSRAEIFAVVATGEKAYQYYQDGRQASQASAADDPIRIKTLQGTTTGQIWLTRNASGTRTVFVISATGSSYNDYTERKRRIAPCVCIV